MRYMFLLLLICGFGASSFQSTTALADVEPSPVPPNAAASEVSVDGDETSHSRNTGAVTRQLSPWDWLVIIGYGSGMLAVGWYYARRTRTADDYLLGGRKMRSLGVGISLFATLLSAVSYLSYPGEVIKYGPMIACIVLAYPVVYVVVGWGIIPPIMKLRVTSAYEILELRLGLTVRMLGATFFLLLRVLWMAMILYACVDKVLVPLLNLDPASSLYICAIMGAITVTYTSMGGLRAVVATDVLQTIILFAGMFLTLGVITFQMGGVGAWWPTEWAPHWQAPSFGYDPTTRVSLVWAVLHVVAWYVCTAASRSRYFRSPWDWLCLPISEQTLTFSAREQPLSTGPTSYSRCLSR